MSKSIIILIIVLLFLSVILFWLPFLFNQLKKISYLKHNKSYSCSFQYDAKKGKLKEDKLPLH